MTTYTVFATVTLRGASMTVEAESEAEAKEIATREPDFDFNGADMSDWEVTSVRDENWSAIPPTRKA